MQNIEDALLVNQAKNIITDAISIDSSIRSLENKITQWEKDVIFHEDKIKAIKKDIYYNVDLVDEIKRQIENENR